jgi:hypothetical protein
MRLDAIFADAAELTPLLAAIRVRRSLTPALRLVTAVFGLGIAQEIVNAWLTSRHVHNTWLNNVLMPVYTGLFLWAFSFWQIGAVSRLAMRLAIPLFVLVWFVLTVLMDGVTGFPRFSGPIQSLLLVCVAAYTLITASMRATDPVWKHDWFWISAGVLLTFGTSTLLQPITGHLAYTHPATAKSVISIWNVIDGTASLLIMGGILCARRHPTSGGSSWPRPSWRASSPSRS